jgi:predicted unusual protein kinase regulating ubiquinone biosynthesis (AarF/ABC1/UbiB family)
MPVNRQQFKERIADVTRKWDSQAKTEGGTYALGDVVGEILLQLQHFNIVLRGDVAASIMTISVSEGLILQLDPEFDLVQSALPFFVRYK